MHPSWPPYPPLPTYYHDAPINYAPLIVLLVLFLWAFTSGVLDAVLASKLCKHQPPAGSGGSEMPTVAAEPVAVGLPVCEATAWIPAEHEVPSGVPRPHLA